MAHRFSAPIVEISILMTEHGEENRSASLGAIGLIFLPPVYCLAPTTEISPSNLKALPCDGTPALLGFCPVVTIDLLGAAVIG